MSLAYPKNMLSSASSSALPPSAIAVLRVLIARRGKVTSRQVLSRDAGFDPTSTRHADVALVDIRKKLGKDSLITVRSRGWMLSDTGYVAAVELMRMISEHL